VRLDDFSQPEPDLALLRCRTDFYWSAHPRAADVLLIVEVAESSLRYDREVKLPLYARHNIPEMWLVDINGRQLTRHRTPKHGRYTQVDEPDFGATLEIEAIRGARLDLSELFPRPSQSLTL
jgi:Uma2 family endonuclease